MVKFTIIPDVKSSDNSVGSDDAAIGAKFKRSAPSPL